jgi:hypothetical protein
MPTREDRVASPQIHTASLLNVDTNEVTDQDAQVSFKANALK